MEYRPGVWSGAVVPNVESCFRQLTPRIRFPVVAQQRACVVALARLLLYVIVITGPESVIKSNTPDMPIRVWSHDCRYRPPSICCLAVDMMRRSISPAHTRLRLSHVVDFTPSFVKECSAVLPGNIPLLDIVWHGNGIQPFAGIEPRSVRGQTRASIFLWASFRPDRAVQDRPARLGGF